MSNTICLVGPPFSLTGDTVFENQQPRFELTFDSISDKELVVASEWYLDNTLIFGTDLLAFSSQMPNGNHTIGVRILTSSGWSGIKHLSFQNLSNGNPTVISAAIEGPSSVQEGVIAVYDVIEQLSDSTQRIATGSYVFQFSGINHTGNFDGNWLTITRNAAHNDTDQGTITAISNIDQSEINKPITIVDTSTIGVLVIDLLNDTSLNVIGFIDNPEVTENHVPAYTGNNIIPTVAPHEALVLASDVVYAITSWRFEFNIAKLTFNYPNTTQFTFVIKGRGAVSQTISGAYVGKTTDSIMQLSGGPGSYVPIVIPDHNVSGQIGFSTSVISGADGNYDEGALTEILRIVYDVTTNQLSLTTY